MQTRFWAIGDTHLSLAKPKDMSRFSERWLDHIDRLAREWKREIAPNDVVLLAGDVSWAQSVNKVLPDLGWLRTLPGRKVLLRGNHDHWWKDVERVRKIVEPMGFYALEGDYLEFDGVLLCGAMGHIAPEDPFYKADPRKDRYNRELKRLELALRKATEKREADQPLLLIMHYPPFTSEGKPTAYVDLITRYQPTVCVYGHLHRDAEWEVACKGEYEGVLYILAASDYLQMIPTQVWPQQNTQENAQAITARQKFDR
ncbi:MAG TPA: metallophosphoesterase [Aggregatilineales bacterium]|nr:metallophosphoesterase [Aggregatilineales bacterium]